MVGMEQARTLRLRLLLFVIVGGLICLPAQFVILTLLQAEGLPPFWADAVAFMASAQLNFLLSYKVTWGDSIRVRGHAMLWRWLTFNIVAFAATWINAGVYDGVHQLTSNKLLGLALAIPVSTVFTFAVNHNVVFPRARQVTPQPRRRFRYDSIAWFLPALNEAANLKLVVPEVVAYLRALGCRFDVIIVNDGSWDDTALVSEELAEQYLEVNVVHHEANYGYGAVLKTGLKAGLDSGHGLIGFMDADMQFRIHSLDPMLREILEADLVLGYRLKRADNFKRRLFSWAWHHFSQMILDFTATDTDCGFKLFRRKVVEALLPQLQGEFATISAEMIARAQRAGFAISEVGVDHYPRREGEQSGSDPRVILGSFRSLHQIRKTIGR